MPPQARFTVRHLPDGSRRLVENAGTPEEAFLLMNRPREELLEIADAIYADCASRPGNPFPIIIADSDDDDTLFELETRLRHEFQESHTRLLADSAALGHELEVLKQQLITLVDLRLPGPQTKYVDVRDGDTMATGYSPVILNNIKAELNGQQRLLKAV